MPQPEAVIAALRERGLTIATAESLTGGALCSALVTVPGASAVVRGGIVAYTADVKARLLGVDPDAIREHGVVSAEVAEAMARGARDATGASIGVATTGVAGPASHDGAPVGTVHLAVAGPTRVLRMHHNLTGDRAAVRAGAVDSALAAVLEALAQDVVAG
ncbi:CinA family protein [Demequina gelatinilytica]|uniref:CinA family protein n=1 Tax=Demequina gelatinilytica TaxID=1638980 RepID=UPI000AD45511|nr:CinA family protein [Demequina gelatinilytica]